MRIALAGLQHETNTFAPGKHHGRSIRGPVRLARTGPRRGDAERLPGTPVATAGALAVLAEAGGTRCP